MRPFNVKTPQEAIDDLRRRIGATRWPEQETVTDESQGVQYAGRVPNDNDQKLSRARKAIGRSTTNFVGRLKLQRITRIGRHLHKVRIIVFGSCLSPEARAYCAC
jgi:hypothetical protein